MFNYVGYSLTVSSGKNNRLKGLRFKVFYQNVVTMVKIALKKILLNNHLNLLSQTCLI